MTVTTGSDIKHSFMNYKTMKTVHKVMSGHAVPPVHSSQSDRAAIVCECDSLPWTV